MPKNKKTRECLNCTSIMSRYTYKYCSNKCQRDYEHDSYIKDWKSARIIGLQGHGIVSEHIKRYLRDKYNDKCCICGWSEINKITKKVPLVADHIDGNWRNNIESNLRLLCPNCDSLTPTYAGLNRGNGRKNRIVSKRALEGRTFVKLPK